MRDLSWKIGALLFEEGIERASHFVNSFGKRQRIPQGYFFNQRSGLLERNPAETPFWKEDQEMKQDYYRSDYRSSATSQNIDTTSLNVEIKDRVRFRVKDNYQNRGAVVDALMQTLGMTKADAFHAFDREAYIVCRPDQFARFLIVRSQSVAVNQFMSLDAKLFPAESKNLYDVSRN